MEQYRSGHNEADSKSVSLSRPVGSNPTSSAKQKLFAFFGKELFCLEGSPLRCFPYIRPVAMPLLLRRTIFSGKRTTSAYSIVAVANDHALRSRKTLLAISFPTWFMTHDPPRKKSH